ncbi:MAG: SMP-30/gluconolactonase/LRE family protein [Planctomycetaceae bacterium]
MCAISRVVFLISACIFAAGVSAEEHVFVPGSAPEELWNGGEFTEGVAVRSDGHVFFSDIPSDPQKNGQVLVFDPGTGITRVYCDRSSKSNGLAFDSGDRLLACCGANGGNRSLCEITESGEVRPLISKFEGQPFNAPNDLVVHPTGAIYFSDPHYVGTEKLSLPGMYLYRFDPKTGSIGIATKAARKPNGVEVSPDGKTLYLAETDNGTTGIPGDPVGNKGLMQLLAFDVAATGALSKPRVIVDFGSENGIDGMAVDSTGRIYAAVRSEKRFGIAVYDPAGKQLDFLATPSLPTNCGFGAGNDSKTLYITAGGGLYRATVQK